MRNAHEEEHEIYDGTVLRDLLDDDQLSPEEAAFMDGYNSALDPPEEAET